MGCVARARCCVGGGACWLPVWAWVVCVFLALRAAIGVLWVRGFLRHFFCLPRVSGLFSGGAAASGVLFAVFLREGSVSVWCGCAALRDAA